MSHHAARQRTRRHSLVLLCLLALVGCQILAVANACVMAMADAAAAVQAATQMADMPGCTDTGSSDQQIKPACPTTDGMPDWSKLPALPALPMPSAYATLTAVEPRQAGPADCGLPRGRAPPLAQLCRWLI